MSSMRRLGWLLALLCMGSHHSNAQSTAFQHVVVIVQENRSPDNLFHALCLSGSSCSVRPGKARYDIQMSDWLNNASPNGVTQPVAVPLANAYDLGHTHSAFVAMCDRVSAADACRMDGAAGETCNFQCIANPQFAYVDNSTGILDPYITLAAQYGWANYMFQTNQGPSFPAHQFLFGATSAPTATDDAIGTFASENMLEAGDKGGCAAPPEQRVQLIDSNGVEDPHNVIFPCFSHSTVGDLISARGFTWRYYAPGADSIWTAPDAIDHICGAVGQTCTGSEWLENVDTVSSDVLSDIAACGLRNVVWAIPTGQNSDHADRNTGGGPSWVASIVNAIGNSKCTDGSVSYWNDTVIFVVWDDWGGWYDHVAPPLLAPPQNGYQYGFRVPFLVVSAYTPKGYIDNRKFDFGSIVRFIEHNYSIRMGSLTFADARAKSDLFTFFDFTMPPRLFQTIPAPLGASHFLDDKSSQLPPDDD